MRCEGSHQDLLTDLERLNPDAALLEPRSVMDRAVVALTDTPEDQWSQDRAPDTWVAVYRGETLVESLVTDGMDYTRALDWVSSNVEGTWVGPGTWVVEWGDPWGGPG